MRYKFAAKLSTVVALGDTPSSIMSKSLAAWHMALTLTWDWNLSFGKSLPYDALLFRMAQPTESGCHLLILRPAGLNSPN